MRFGAVALLVMVAATGVVAEERDKVAPPPAGDARAWLVEMRRTIGADELRQDLAQFRGIVKREWILANLNDADFDAAIDRLERENPNGISRADLALGLHRILCLGMDGHARVSQWPAALASVEGAYQDFLIDLCGQRYVAYRVQSLAAGPVNPKKKYRFRLLNDACPYLTSIDGVPIETWVKAAEAYVPRGPELTLRWQSMDYLQYLPYFRRELKLPETAQVRVRLASEDGKSEIEMEAATSRSSQHHLHLPKPNWEILNGRIGYINLRNPAGRVESTVMETMPKLRGTKGLVLDLRGNHGGEASGLLKIVASYLLSPAEPRVVVGQVVRWKDTRRSGWALATPLVPDGLSEQARAEMGRLSDDGRRLLADCLASHKPQWQPPAHRETVSQGVLLARPEAEPELFPYSSPLFPKDTYYYDRPVVLLYDHRCFSAAELFLAGIRCLPNVTLVGTPTTSCGGGGTESFKLANSELIVLVAQHAFVRRDGRLIDGQGIEPDVVVQPDVDYYLGTADRMLDRAIGVLEEKIAATPR